MNTIEQEKKFLEEINKHLFKFSQKNKKLSELKESFYQKLDKAETNKNEEEAKKYYLALLRSINLSNQIYSNLLKFIQKDFSLLTLPKQSKIPRNISLNSEEQEILSLIEDSEKTYLTFISKFKTSLDKLTKDHSSTLFQLEEQIQKEKQLIEILGNKTTIIEEIHYEKELHEIITKEKKLEFQIQTEIDEILKELNTFFGEDFKSFGKRHQITLVKLQNYLGNEKNKLHGGLFNYLVEKGGILEKHASIFAALVVGLSGATALTAILGLGSAAAVFSSTFGIIATLGEALQALPFLQKNIIPNIQKQLHYYLEGSSQDIGS